MFGCDLAGTLKSHLRVEAGKPGANQNFWSRVSVERMACQITEDGLACSSDYGIVMTLASGSTTGSSEPLDACPCRKDMRPTCRIQAAKGSSAIFNSLTFHGHYQEIVGSYACLLMWRKLPQVLCLLETILAQSSCIKLLQYLVRCQLCVLHGIENIHEWQKRMQSKMLLPWPNRACWKSSSTNTQSMTPVATLLLLDERNVPDKSCHAVSGRNQGMHAHQESRCEATRRCWLLGYHTCYECWESLAETVRSGLQDCTWGLCMSRFVALALLGLDAAGFCSDGRSCQYLHVPWEYERLMVDLPISCKSPGNRWKHLYIYLSVGMTLPKLAIEGFGPPLSSATCFGIQSDAMLFQ